MTLYFDKEKCNIRDDINGRVVIIETDEPVYIEDMDAKMLLFNQWNDTFGDADKPFLTDAPKEYKI